MKGDILSLLIIPKLPFSVPDPIDEYNSSQYSNLDEYKNSVVIPKMLIKLKQGVGRLIRTETDTGVVAILDSRYRNRVLEALPNYKFANDMKDVQSFISLAK